MAVISLTLGVGALSVYQVVARNLYARLDQTLANLANAAAHSLPIEKSNEVVGPSAKQEKDAEDEQERAQHETEHQPNSSDWFNGFRGEGDRWLIDRDDDLDLAWQNLRQPQQTIEWFDAAGLPLFQVGESLPRVPLSASSNPAQIDGLRVLAVPVYDRSALLGYVRVASDTTAINSELSRLRQGLTLGGLVALSICGLGSWGLMRLAMAPIETSFERLRQFTADASHELRSPLTAVKTSIEVMQSHPERLQLSDLEKINFIASANQQMTQLVDDLLLLARLDNSFVAQHHVTQIPIDELLEDLAVFYQLQATTHGIDFKLSLAADRATVWGDSNQLKRLFSNLLANALKYTPTQGTIELISEIQEASVVVQVKDSGIGIASEHLPYVFDRFWQADPARSHRSGSGLGLAIAQSIVQAHKGHIHVISRLGEGTIVHIKLPLS